MAYSTFTLTGTFKTTAGVAESVTVTAIPSVPLLVDGATGGAILSGVVSQTFSNGVVSMAGLPTLGGDILPASGWGYTVLVTTASGQQQARTITTPPAGGSSLDIKTLTSTPVPVPLTDTAVGLSALDSLISAKVTDAASLTRDALDLLFAAQPGAELAYAELEADFTTTNTTNTSVVDGPGAGGVIPSLTVGPIVGAGRAVSIDFHAPQVRHTTAGGFVNAYLIVNGVANGTDGQNSLSDSPATNIGRELTMHRRLVLTNGVSYTFKVGIQGGLAGTVTLDGADGTAISLSVISR